MSNETSPKRSDGRKPASHSSADTRGMRSVKCPVVVGTKTLFFSDGDVTFVLSVVLSNTPREPHELPATLRAWGGGRTGMRGHGRSGAEAEVVCAQGWACIPTFYFIFLTNKIIIRSVYFRRFLCHFYQKIGQDCQSV